MKIFGPRGEDYGDHYEIIEETDRVFVIHVCITEHSIDDTLAKRVHEILQQKQGLERTVVSLEGIDLNEHFGEFNFFLTGDSVDCEHLILCSERDAKVLRGLPTTDDDDVYNYLNFYDFDKTHYFDGLVSLTIYPENNGMESSGLFTEDLTKQVCWSSLQSLYSFTELDRNHYTKLHEPEVKIRFPNPDGLKRLRYEIYGRRDSIEKLVSALPPHLEHLHLVVIVPKNGDQEGLDAFVHSALARRNIQTQTVLEFKPHY